MQGKTNGLGKAKKWAQGVNSSYGNGKEQVK